jgi:hypothetical protein
MTGSTRLERRYRRLLAFYPKAFRREREQEILIGIWLVILTMILYAWAITAAACGGCCWSRRQHCISFSPTAWQSIWSKSAASPLGKLDKATGQLAGPPTSQDPGAHRLIGAFKLSVNSQRTNAAARSL